MAATETDPNALRTRIIAVPEAHPLVLSAKAVAINVTEYLTDVVDKLAGEWDVARIRELVPTLGPLRGPLRPPRATQLESSEYGERHRCECASATPRRDGSGR